MSAIVARSIGLGERRGRRARQREGDRGGTVSCMAIRTPSERKADTQQRLEHDSNVWVATASDEGIPHMIPLSLGWDGARILVTTPTESPTARNALSSGRARASLDSALDVVIVDAAVEVVDVATASADVVTTYVDRVGWNPSDQSGDWSLLILTPRTVLAWNSVAEIQGRTIMRLGIWAT